MAVLNCEPPYAYRPTFIPGSTPCAAPVFPEHRSRLFLGGTYFRSYLIISAVEVQSTACNDISLTITKDTSLYTLTVKYQNVVVETYSVTQTESDGSPTCTGDAIGELRTDVNTSSNYISLPERGDDTEYDETGEDNICLSEFTEISMSEGNGGPLDGSAIASIRTGPERTIFIVSTTEDLDGTDIDPPANKRVNQWDGSTWITYVPNSDCI